MNKKLIAISASVILLALPVMGFAALGDPVNPVLFDLPSIVAAVVRILITLALVAAAISFLVAAFYFVTANGDPALVQKGRQAIIYAAVGLVIALIAYSIPSIIVTLGGF